MRNVDLLIIGAGPGGYSAAVRASQLGMKTMVVDERALPGGTCLHVGCIPSKALLFSTEMAHFFQHDASTMGIYAKEISLDFQTMQKRSSEIVSSLAQAIGSLFTANHIEFISKKAVFTERKTVQVDDETIQAEKIILATGSLPISLPFLPIDEKRVLSSEGALALSEVPASLLIIGGGIIGLEMASIFARLGSQVTVIELLDEVAFALDHEIARALRSSLTKMGIHFSLQTRVTSANLSEAMIELTTDKGSFTGDKVLVSIGRKPNTGLLALDKTGVDLDQKGFISINSAFETSQKGIYAIGDLVNGPMLAHKAEEEGIVLAEILAGKKATIDLFSIPSVVYTFPEAASCGYTEKEARAQWKTQGRELILGKFPLRALGRAKAMGVEEGLVKILADKNSRRLIGLHLLSPNASEMIHVGVIALKERMTIDQMRECSFAHPTLSEGIKEALWSTR